MGEAAPVWLRVFGLLVESEGNPAVGVECGYPCDTGVYSDTAVGLTSDGRQVSRLYFVDERDYTWGTQCNIRGVEYSIHSGIN